MLLAVAAVLTGCEDEIIIGKKTSYRDGTYTARSDVRTEEEAGYAAGYGEVTITITDGKITACDFKTYDVDGNLKDEDYGRYVPEEPEEENTDVTDGEEEDEGEENNEQDTPDVDTEGMYTDAQFAVSAAQKYAEMLAESGSLEKTDAISGATYNYSEFKEAVSKALEQARVEE